MLHFFSEKTTFRGLSQPPKSQRDTTLKQDQDRLKKIQSQHSKAKKGSTKRKKKRKALCKTWKKVSNRRQNFCHQISRQIVNQFDFIAMEDLDIKQMMSDNFRAVNRTISDVAWNQFRQMVSYKAEEAGKTFVAVNPKNTSRLCSKCGNLVFKELDERTHSCPSCGLEMDRDINASLNILRIGLDSLSAY